MSPLYLAALLLNPRSREANRDLTSADAMHARIWHLIPGTIPKEFGRLLWRVDVVDGRHMVLIQCALEPEPSRLPVGYVTQARCKRIDGSLRTIALGDTLRFRLRANPTHMIYGPDKRLTIRERGAQVAWLARKMDDIGAQASSIGALDEGAVRRRGGAQYGSVRYEGLLRVTDPSRFVPGVAAGIGPAKAWGFGLLSLARPE